MRDIEHPQITRTIATGYPTREHSEHEVLQEIKHVEDYPQSDMFGTEIRPGDGYFIAPNGDVVDAVNIEDYLIEVVGCNVFIAKK